MRNELGRFITGNLTETGQYYNETGLSAVMYASYFLAASGGAVAGGTAMITISPVDNRIPMQSEYSGALVRTDNNPTFTRTET